MNNKSLCRSWKMARKRNLSNTIAQHWLLLAVFETGDAEALQKREKIKFGWVQKNRSCLREESTTASLCNYRQQWFCFFFLFRSKLIHFNSFTSKYIATQKKNTYLRQAIADESLMLYCCQAILKLAVN